MAMYLSAVVLLTRSASDKPSVCPVWLHVSAYVGGGNVRQVRPPPRIDLSAPLAGGPVTWVWGPAAAGRQLNTGFDRDRACPRVGGATAVTRQLLVFGLVSVSRFSVIDITNQYAANFAAI